MWKSKKKNDATDAELKELSDDMEVAIKVSDVDATLKIVMSTVGELKQFFSQQKPEEKKEGTKNPEEKLENSAIETLTLGEFLQNSQGAKSENSVKEQKDWLFGAFGGNHE